MSGHAIGEGAKSQFPAVGVHAVYNFATRCDVKFEPGERVAFAELQQQLAAMESIDHAVHRQVQRRQRPCPNLLDVLQRRLLFVDHRLREAEQSFPGLGELRLFSSEQ